MNETAHTACWVAAWPTAASAEALRQAGVQRVVHLTTFYNAKVRLSLSEPLPQRLATITDICEWTTGRGRCIVALLACEGNWSHALNAALVQLHGSTERNYRPHLTLERRAAPGRARAYRHLVGTLVVFDRHGVEQCTRAASEDQSA
ncbi:hypothetical protein D3C76_966040 [compost metagenome]